MIHSKVRLHLIPRAWVTLWTAAGGFTLDEARLRSVRSLGELEKALKPHGFVRVHKSHLVNLDRVREVRLRKGDDNDWEVKLDPPVNSVLPVGRGHLAALKRSLGI